VSLPLRQYQTECIQSIHNNYSKGVSRQLIHLPTASGKTVIFSNLIQQASKKTLVLAHTLELLDQAKSKINMICPGLDVGVVSASRKEFDKTVVISTIQSASQEETLKRLKQQDFQLCVYDECHRAASDSSKLVLNELGFTNSTNKLLCGFSATPFRTDDKGLGEVFQKVVFHRSVKSLIDDGFLCRPVGKKIKTDLDLSKVATADGDFKQESLASYMNTPQMNELVVETFVENAPNRKTVCFCVTVDHSETLAAVFRSRGINAQHICGSTPSFERKRILEDFNRGDIQVLTNCALLTEGWDSPSIDCVIIAKPTQSKGLFQQMAGRGLRLFPNKKDCLILDFGSKTHSLCSLAELVEDAESASNYQDKEDTKLSALIKSLPPKINKKLKAAIIEMDLLGEDFTWIKDGDDYVLKASKTKTLRIFPISDSTDSFSVIFKTENESKKIVDNVSFEYAFGAAEEFAKNNRETFVISDLDADWRSLPISDKQKKVFKAFRYKTGIDDLTRGQASMILSIGVLNKRSRPQ